MERNISLFPLAWNFQGKEGMDGWMYRDTNTDSKCVGCTVERTRDSLPSFEGHKRKENDTPSTHKFPVCCLCGQILAPPTPSLRNWLIALFVFPKEHNPIYFSSILVEFSTQFGDLRALTLPDEDSEDEDAKDTDPIIPRTTIGYREHKGSTSSGIASVTTDISPVKTDTSSSETVNLVCEYVNADQPQCRICLDLGGDDVIAPCFCKGTQKYVHRSCLDNWRAVKEGFAFAHCTECRARFNLRADIPPDRWWSRLKFQLLVIRDHTAIFIVVQVIVALLGMLVYKFYGEELREMFGYEQHPYGFYLLAVLAVLLVGLLYGFFIAIICGQKISDRHYHVLAKQELTKEYVVESREENEEPPELDSAHISELKMLGLY